MSAQTQSLRRSFLSAAQSWPVDKLRPTLNFGAALEAATTRIFDNPSPSASPALKQLTPSQLLKAERTFISLQNLMTDTARNAYPITNKTLKPASFPNHYERLRKGIEMAERGEGIKRGWFSWIRWK